MPDKEKLTEMGFEKVPVLIKEMEAVWNKNFSKNAEVYTINSSDLEVFKKAFIQLLNYTKLIDRWYEANRLFHDKENFKPKDYDKAAKEAVKILEIVKNTSKLGRGDTFNRTKDDEIRHYYFVRDVVCLTDEKGRWYFDEKNKFNTRKEYRKNIIEEIKNKYGFTSERAVEEYLRNKLGFTNVPSFKNHSKKPK